MHLTSVPLGYSFFERNGCVFWREKPITGALPETFVALNHHWGKDANHVYCQDLVLRNADPETFIALNALFAKDRANVYWYRSVIKDADPATFEPIGDDCDWDFVRGYARDCENVYHAVLTIGKPNKVKSARREMFRALGNGYGTDGTSVFYEMLRLPGADPSSWRYLGQGYSVDERRVFYFNCLLKTVDPRSLEILPGASFSARVGGSFFSRGEPTEAAAYFNELLGMHIMKGTVVEAYVMDSAGDPVPNCIRVPPAENGGLVLRIRCDGWMYHADHQTSPANGDIYTLRQFRGGTIADWPGRRWIWFLRRFDKHSAPGLRGKLCVVTNWHEITPCENESRIESLLAEAKHLVGESSA
jgi:hypothetical protein